MNVLGLNPHWGVTLSTRLQERLSPFERLSIKSKVRDGPPF
jgi:hypothetical protein